MNIHKVSMEFIKNARDTKENIITEMGECFNKLVPVSFKYVDREERYYGQMYLVYSF